MKNEDEIRNVLIAAKYERQDYSDYDYDDNFICDDGYIGWQNAVDFIAEKLGIKITEDDIWEYAMNSDD